MANEQYVPARLDKALCLPMDLADQRAGRVQIIEAARLGGCGNDLGNAMGGEHHRTAIRYLIQLLDEYRPQSAKPVNDKAIVDDFMAHIDRRPEPLDRQFNNLDGAVDAGAKSARRRD